MSDINPYAAPSQESMATEVFPDRDYGGIGRAAYFGLSFAIGVLNNIVQYAADKAGATGVVLVTAIIGLVVTIVLAVQRLKNLGYSGWWTIGLIVPILNILVGLRCLAAPEGYADHKTLDTAGKIIIGLVIGLFVLVVVAAISMA